MLVAIHKILQTRMSEDQDVACCCIISTQDVDIFCHITM